MLAEILISAFRGMKNMRFELGQKTHIVGKNGSGKTHILDAIHLLTSAKNIYGNSRLDANDRIEAIFREDFFAKNFTLAENA